VEEAFIHFPTALLVAVPTQIFTKRGKPEVSHGQETFGFMAIW